MSTKKLVRYAVYAGLIQLVYIYCGPHWVIGGLLASFIAQNIKPLLVADASPSPENQSDKK